MTEGNLQNMRIAQPAEVDLSVVIPVLNEEDGLLHCYQEVVSSLEATNISFELVFVDDGSSDSSPKIMQGFAEQDDRVHFLQLFKNVGQQKAMFSALRYCGGSVIITFDSDLQFAPSCLQPLYKAIADKKYDIAGGIRENRQDSFLKNKLPSYIGRKLINRALRIKQKDFGAVKAYSRAIIWSILQEPAPLIVIPAMAYSNSQNFIEIPIAHNSRKAGESKWSILSRMELYVDIFTVYARRPFETLMLFGALFSFLGFCFLLGIMFYKIFINAEFSGLIIFFSVFLVTGGVFMFVQALIGEFVLRILRNKPPSFDGLVKDVHSNRINK